MGSRAIMGRLKLEMKSSPFAAKADKCGFQVTGGWQTEKHVVVHGTRVGNGHDGQPFVGVMPVAGLVMGSSFFAADVDPVIPGALGVRFPAYSPWVGQCQMRFGSSAARATGALGYRAHYNASTEGRIVQQAPVAVGQLLVGTDAWDDGAEPIELGVFAQLTPRAATELFHHNSIGMVDFDAAAFAAVQTAGS